MRRATSGRDSYILSNVNIQRGEEIASDKLVADLNWLNLNPYRNVAVGLRACGKIENKPTLRSRKVTPGASMPATRTAARRNEPQSGVRRFQCCQPAIPGSPTQLPVHPPARTFWYEDGDLFGGAGNAAYVSHSAFTLCPYPGGISCPFKPGSSRPMRSCRAHSLNKAIHFRPTLNTPFLSCSPVHSSSRFTVAVLQAADDRFAFWWPVRRSPPRLMFGNLVAGARGSLTDRLGLFVFDVRGVFSPGDVFGEQHRRSLHGGKWQSQCQC